MSSSTWNVSRFTTLEIFSMVPFIDLLLSDCGMLEDEIIWSSALASRSCMPWTSWIWMRSPSWNWCLEPSINLIVAKPLSDSEAILWMRTSAISSEFWEST